MSTLNLSVDSDGVALIVIDLIDRPINVFTPEFVNDLSQAVEQILREPASPIFAMGELSAESD